MPTLSISLIVGWLSMIFVVRSSEVPATIDFLLLYQIEMTGGPIHIDSISANSYQKKKKQFCDRRYQASMAGVCQKLQSLRQDFANNPQILARLLACERIVPGFQQIDTFGSEAANYEPRNLWPYVLMGGLGVEIHRAKSNMGEVTVGAILNIVTKYVCNEIDLEFVQPVISLCNEAVFAPNWPSAVGCARINQIYRPDGHGKRFRAISLEELLDDLGRKVRSMSASSSDTEHRVWFIIYDYLTKILYASINRETLLAKCQEKVAMKGKQTLAMFACELILRYSSANDGEEMSDLELDSLLEPFDNQTDQSVSVSAIGVKRTRDERAIANYVK